MRRRGQQRLIRRRRQARAQMFMDNGSEIPVLERTACVTYDQRSAESQGAQVLAPLWPLARLPVGCT